MWYLIIICLALVADSLCCYVDWQRDPNLGLSDRLQLATCTLRLCAQLGLAEPSLQHVTTHVLAFLRMNRAHAADPHVDDAADPFFGPLEVY